MEFNKITKNTDYHAGLLFVLKSGCRAGRVFAGQRLGSWDNGQNNLVMSLAGLLHL